MSTHGLHIHLVYTYTYVYTVYIDTALNTWKKVLDTSMINKCTPLTFGLSEQQVV